MKKRSAVRTRRTPLRMPFKLPSDALGRSGMRLAIIVLLLITLSVVANFGEQVVRSARMENDRIELEAEVERLKVDNQHLEAAAAFAESDVYVEQRARELLNYAREGDKVILPQLPPIQPTAVPEPLALPEPVRAPNWMQWWQAFASSE